jgi:hypothetical protein
MKKLSTRWALFGIFWGMALSLLAEPPGKGQGHGKGKGGGDFQGVIHALFAAHETIDRVVEITDSGYRAKTTSQDKAVAALLQKHVAEMAARLDGGMSVRHWDPAFAEFREHYDDTTVVIDNIEGGVSVTVSGKTPAAIKVVRNHAAIVSGFVEKGSKEMHQTHPAVIVGPSAKKE